jgi:hypothetical protein
MKNIFIDNKFDLENYGVQKQMNALGTFISSKTILGMWSVMGKKDDRYYNWGFKLCYSMS